jgi:GxxExxY protein
LIEIGQKRPKTTRLPAGRALAIRVGMHPETKRFNDLSEKIIGAAIAVHRALGPGLLEAPYEECLCHELEKLGLKFERQKPLPLVYGNVNLACAYRMDLVVENSIIVEVKAVAKVDRVHEAQLISYLKISGLHLGLLLNFNVRNLSREGIVRKVNEFPE